MAGGLVILQGTNTYTGATNVTGGTLQMGALNATSSASPLVMNAGGTFDLYGFSQVVGDLSGTGGTVTNNSSGSPALTVNQATNGTFSGLLTGSMGLTKSGGGTLTLGAANGYTGATTINAGILRIGVAGAIPAASSLSMSGGSLDLNDNAQTLAGLSGTGGTVMNSGSGTPVLTVNGGGTFAGLIIGGVALTKSGAGTVILAGTNTYAGPTTVSGGELRVNGSVTSAVTVNSGGAIGGSGTLGGGLALSGGTVMPGNGGIGTLSVTGSASLGGGSTYEWQLSSTSEQFQSGPAVDLRQPEPGRLQHQQNYAGHGGPGPERLQQHGRLPLGHRHVRRGLFGRPREQQLQLQRDQLRPHAERARSACRSRAATCT